MPRYIRVYSVIRVIGPIWQPGITAAADITLDARDMDQIRNGRPVHQVTREDVADWLTTHKTGDFQHITDFEALLSDESGDREIPWASEDNELAYNDCMFPAED